MNHEVITKNGKKLASKNLLRSAIVGLGMILSGAAEAHQSQFNLKMFDNSAFAVMFDGSWMGQPTPQFTLSGVCDGAHMLKVVKYIPTPYCGMQPKVIYWSNIVIPKNSKVFAMINCEGAYQVSCVEPVHPGNGWGHGGWNNGGWNNENTGWGGNNGGSCGGGYGGGYNGGSCGPQCMSPESFQMLKCAVESKQFDNTRLEVAKQAIAMNYLSSQQVSCLMGMLVFEHNKLDLAKYAYTHTVDKQNYFVVNNNFTFSYSVNELNEYIAHI